MARKRQFVLLVVLGILILFLLAFDTRLKTVTYHLKSSEISDEVRFVLVTDLHSCYYGENQSKLFHKIDPYHPDAVFLVGDIFDDVLDNTNSKIFVSRIAEKYKTYYVSGNHEWWKNEMYDFFEFLTENDVTVLRGNSEILQIGENSVVVSGIDDPEVNRYDSTFTNWEEQLRQVGESADDGKFHILLAHRPENIEKYVRYDFDVILSGHAHGGQFRIPFLMNGFYAPNQGFFPKLAGGEYDFQHKKLIVSRGLSMENQRLPRIFNRPELVFLTVTSE